MTNTQTSQWWVYPQKQAHYLVALIIVTVWQVELLQQFSNKVDIFSVINSSLKNLKGLNLKKNKDLIFEKNYPNLIKERIVEKDKNGNLKKILTINHFKNSQIDKSIEKKFFNKIKNKIKNYDLVILQDFGHGLITDKIAKLIERQSKKLSINVQTNSLNYGFKIRY